MPEGHLSLPWIIHVLRIFGGFPVDVDPRDPSKGSNNGSRLQLTRPILSILVLFVIPVVLCHIATHREFEGSISYAKLAEVMEVRAEDTLYPFVLLCTNLCFCLVNLALFVARGRDIVTLYNRLHILETRTLLFPTGGGEIRGKKVVWSPGCEACCRG